MNTSVLSSGRRRRLGYRVAAAIGIAVSLQTLTSPPALAVSSACSSTQQTGSQVVVTCSYTGGLQTFTVPDGITLVTLDAQGAQGGSISAAGGGAGGEESGTLSVKGGEVLSVLVGGAGAPPAAAGGGGGSCSPGTGGAGGYGGGASGADATAGGGQCPYGGGGGGGGSFVYNGQDNLVLAAGGGGGGSPTSCPDSPPLGDGGGDSGGTASCAGSGGGGTQSAGGVGGGAASPGSDNRASWTAGAPAPGAGGAGAAQANQQFGGGGGGGGYFGGGGGDSAPGGGGSGFAAASLNSVNKVTGINSSGNGVVTITYSTAPSITSPDAAGFRVGHFGAFTIRTSGLPAPSLSDGGASLPRGVTFTDNGDGTATLKGKPAAGTGGAYHFTVTASNGVSPDATQNFTLYVKTPCPGVAGPHGIWVIRCSDVGFLQTFTVPAGLTRVWIDAKGAQGGASSAGDAGAKGGNASGMFAVSRGEVLTVLVGGAGATATGSAGGSGGFGGGAAGGGALGSGGSPAGGGGGGSFVFDQAGDALVAAWGGGGSGAGCAGGGGGGDPAGDGSCPFGGPGGTNQNVHRLRVCIVPVMGGSFPGSPSGTAFWSAGAIVPSAGGSGGTSTASGGGGGGGYNGGGGGCGGSSSGDNGGGGGGSGFLAPSAISPVSSNGATRGGGQVTIAYRPGRPRALIARPASGKAYKRGQVVATDFRCTESSDGPGLKTCMDSNGKRSRSGAPTTGHLNTAKLGQHTYTVTAISKDGQRDEAQITYTVVAR